MSQRVLVFFLSFAFVSFDSFAGLNSSHQDMAQSFIEMSGTLDELQQLEKEDERRESSGCAELLLTASTKLKKAANSLSNDDIETAYYNDLLWIDMDFNHYYGSWGCHYANRVYPIWSRVDDILYALRDEIE